jgi:hypothetical protein
MDVLGRMIRVQNEAFDLRWAEVEHPRFTVIDPNDGMIVMLAHAKKFPSGHLRDMRTSERAPFDEKAWPGAAIHWFRAQ